MAHLLIMAAEAAPNAPYLTWRDSKTKDVIFTSNDIVSFDWQKQIFLLKPDNLLDFYAWIPPHMSLWRGMYVADAKGTIYETRWVSNSCSLGFDGPILGDSRGGPVLSILDAYPPGHKSQGEREKRDLRFDPRLKAGLEKARVLRSIDENAIPDELIVRPIHSGWKDVGDDVKVRVEYYPHTFRINREARAHVFFACDEKTAKNFDCISVKIRVRANKGLFEYDSTIRDIPISVINNGIYVCKFWPWTRMETENPIPTESVASVSMTILFEKNNGKRFKTVYRLEFEEYSIPILSK
jgi:hypothetical protein